MSPPGSGEEKPVPPARDRASRGPRDFLTILFKHRFRVSVIFFAAVLAAAAWSFLVPPVYEAKSTLMVKIGGQSTEDAVNPEVRILSSREVIETVLTALKVETVYPELAVSSPSTTTRLQAAVLAFGKNLTVAGVGKSGVIEVVFRHKDPQVAARAVNLLVDGSKKKNLEVFGDPPSSFLERQLAGYETERKEIERRLEAFQRKNRFFFPEEQKSLLLKRYQEANAREAAPSSRLGAIEIEIRSFDRLDKEFQELKREAASSEMKYRTGLGRLEETRISEEMNRKRIANIVVIQPAAVPTKTATPNKGWNLLLGMLLGAVSGLGVAFFSEYTSESFSTPGIAERQLALPVLATIRHRD